MFICLLNNVSERLKVVVNRLTGGQICSQAVDGRQVDMSTGQQVHMLTKYLVLSG